MHHLALEFAEDAARKALNGPKNVDVCQAFLLLAVYPKPKKKWAEDNSWLLMGVAIRYLQKAMPLFLMLRLLATAGLQ